MTETSLPRISIAAAQVPEELDAASADRFERLVTDLIQQRGDGSGRAIVVVDLSHVGFIDSSGVRALLQLRRAAERAGMTLRVSHPQPIVEKVFDILRVRDVLVHSDGDS